MKMVNPIDHAKMLATMITWCQFHGGRTAFGKKIPIKMLGLQLSEITA